MEAKKILAIGLFAAVGLIGCGGDDAIQSPDFTPVLKSLTLSSDAPPDTSAGAPAGQRMLAAGQSASLDVVGSFSTPPGYTDSNGAPASTVDQSIGNAAFRLSPDGVARIEDGRLVGESAGGVVTVTATRDGIESNTITFRIAAAVLLSLDVSPNTATISTSETANFSAVGTFSDGTVSPVVVDWVVNPGGVVSLSDANGQSTTATPASGSGGQSATLTASAPSGDGSTVTDTATINISNNEMLSALIGLRPSNPTVAPTASIEFTAEGSYTDGTTTRTGDIPDSEVIWASSAPAVAPIDANGIATGQPPGGQQTTITASLRGTVITPAGSSRTASTVLTVTDTVCTEPLLAVQGATTSSEISALCIGCTVTNPNNVIDGDVNSFATLAAVLGLPSGTVTLNVDASPVAIDFAAGQRVGFVVAQPAGLLSAELLSSLSLSTRNNGVVVEEAGAQQDRQVLITALGEIGGQEAALLSFVTAQPYDGVAVTFNAGVASVLPSINVIQACSTAVDN